MANAKKTQRDSYFTNVIKCMTMSSVDQNVKQLELLVITLENNLAPANISKEIHSMTAVLITFLEKCLLMFA
jgi:hypothetical protein